MPAISFQVKINDLLTPVCLTSACQLRRHGDE
jgi:hypothetical protein